MKKTINDLFLYIINKPYSASPEELATAILKEKQETLKEEVDKWMTYLLTGHKPNRHYYIYTDKKGADAFDKVLEECLKSERS